MEEENERSDRSISMKLNDSSKIRVSTSNSMATTRQWSQLSMELLCLIFTLVKPVDLMVRTVPFVCRSWREAAAEPDCWAHVDLERWCRHVSSPSTADAAICWVARRSRGTMRSLSVYGISNSAFFYACFSGSLLRVLKMPMSEVTDQMVEKPIEALSMLTVLDISYCLKITSKSIEALGNCCKDLVEFIRNMPPPSYEASEVNGAAGNADESEAVAVANAMHGIEHLELVYGRFSNHGLKAILVNCGALRVLDIRGCWNVNLEGEVGKKCYSIQSFMPPWENEDDFSGDGDNKDDAEDGDDCDTGLVDVDTTDDPDDDGYD